MKPIKLYLIAYNLASALGWAYVLYLAVTCFLANKTPKEAWAELGGPLMVIQTTMAMEILHALVGFVPSPVFVTALQVSSRLWVVWGATYCALECQSHWSLYLMVVSWCLAEVPRYLFYVSNLATGSVPSLLFFVR
jgi:very-long-chain (3R)-3-hydroxyacyl-CoA dehydratase